MKTKKAFQKTCGRIEKPERNNYRTLTEYYDDLILYQQKVDECFNNYKNIEIEKTMPFAHPESEPIVSKFQQKLNEAMERAKKAKE